MQINEATKRATATRRESDERNSSMTRMGAEIGTAADGQTKAERRRLMEAVVERNNLWLAYERVMRTRVLPESMDLAYSTSRHGCNSTGLASKQHCWRENIYRRQSVKWTYPSPMAGCAHWGYRRCWIA